MQRIKLSKPEVVIHISICRLAMTLPMFIVFIVYYIHLKDPDSLLKYKFMLNDWQQNPITDIYIPSSPSNNCKDNETPLFYYYWPGIKQSKYSNGASAQEFYSWDIGTNSTQQVIRLCGIQLEGYNFRNYTKFQNCDQDSKICSDLSSTDFQYCIPKQFKCPIQLVSFGNQSLSKAGIYESQQLNANTQMFVYRNVQDRLPLSQFRVAMSTFTCWDKTQTYDPNFSFTGDQRSNNCKKTDQLYTNTNFTLSEQQYFQANNALGYFSDLRYKFDNQSKYYFLQKSYFELPSSCRPYMDDYYNYLDQLYTFRTFLLAYIICEGIFIGYYVLLESFVIKKYYYYQFDYIVFRKQARFKLKVIKLIRVALMTITLAFPIAGFTLQIFIATMGTKIIQDCLVQEIVNEINNLNGIYIAAFLVQAIFRSIIFFSESTIRYLISKCLCLSPNKCFKYILIENKPVLLPYQLNLKQISQQTQVQQEIQNQNIQQNQIQMVNLNQAPQLQDNIQSNQMQNVFLIPMQPPQNNMNNQILLQQQQQQQQQQQPFNTNQYQDYQNNINYYMYLQQIQQQQQQQQLQLEQIQAYQLPTNQNELENNLYLQQLQLQYPTQSQIYLQIQQEQQQKQKQQQELQLNQNQGLPNYNNQNLDKKNNVETNTLGVYE
ncbi:hypothetical protein ABPG74_019351 [Tetrahymena malaccensis]